MSNSIDVSSLHSLEELETSIARFSSEVREAIEAAQHQIQKKAELLDQIVNDRGRAVSSWQAAYDGADEEEDDVSLIRHKLEEAEDNLREAKQWQRRVEEVCQEYRKRANYTAYLGGAHSDKVRGFLRERIAELYDYVNLKPNGAGGISGGSQPSATGVMSAAATTVSSVLSSGAALTQLNLPKGFGWIRLDTLKPDEMAELPAENDYQKNQLSEADMREGLELLYSRILPEIQKDPARATREHFAELDSAESRSGSKSLADIFSAYFGQHDHVWVDRFKDDQFFGIGNGRHRIKAARYLGWSAIPGRIVEVNRS